MSKSEIISAVRPVINLFEDLKIPYYVGGSLASSSLGISRATMDVDLITNLQPILIDTIVQQLESDYYIDRDMIKDAIKHNSSFNIIHHSTSYKIDFFVSKLGEYQQKIFERITRKKFIDEDDEFELFICSAEDVVLTKLLWFKEREGVSEKQWTDILGVLKVQQNNIDLNYLHFWAKKLSINDELKKALSDSGLT